jgi:hypothetical protein
MTPTDETRDTIRPATLTSDKYAIVTIEASPGARDRAPQYVDSVLQELRQIVARARCPSHGCGPTLTVDFGSGAQESLLVVPHNCCATLDEVVARALRVYPLFHLQRPESTQSPY